MVGKIARIIGGELVGVDQYFSTLSASAYILNPSQMRQRLLR